MRRPPSGRNRGPIELRLLGAPAWRIAGTGWQPLFAYEALVLAMLAVEGPRRRDEVAFALWPEDTARANLRQRIYKLRGRSGHAWVSEGDVLELLDTVRSDVADACAAAPEAQPTDELLATVDESRLTKPARRCVAHLRQRVQDLRLQHLEREAARLQAEADPRGAAALLDRALSLAPTNERLWQLRLELQAQLSDLQGALAMYERLMAALNEAGRDPTPQTTLIRARLERARALPKELPSLPAALRAPAPFVGRARAWSAMQAAWDERRAFVVIGQAGIGKSRLLAEFLAGRRAAGPATGTKTGTTTSTTTSTTTGTTTTGTTTGTTGTTGTTTTGTTTGTSTGTSTDANAGTTSITDTTIAAAAEGDAQAPYSTALRWLLPMQRLYGLPEDPRGRSELARLLPDAGPAPAADSNPVVLRRALVEAMRHAHKRGLSTLVIDDLHHADAASLRLLEACIEGIDGLRVALATRELERRDVDGPWQRLVADNAHVVAITLEGLSVAETSEMLERLDLGIPGLTARAAELAAHCGGIPYYLGEVLRDLVLRGAAAAPFGVPSSLGPRLEWQLMRLGPEALALARIAAVAGHDYDLGLAARARSLATDALAPAWQELRANHVFVGDGFAHDLVREAVLAAVAPPLARELHARVAACLLDRNAAPERVAHHYAAAEHWAAAAAASERAALRAERLGQREDQLRHADAAEAWYRRAGDAEHAQQVGIRALVPSLEHEGSDTADARAQRLAAACSNPAQRAAVDAQRARIALWQLDSGRALQFADAATAAAGPEDVVARAVAAAVAGIALAWRGDVNAGLARIEPIVADIDSIADPWLRHEVWNGYGIVLANDERWRQISLVMPRAVADARRHGDAAGEADTLSSMAVAAGSLGDVVAAVAHARQADALHTTMDNPQGERVNRINLACNLATLGLHVEALELLDAVLEQARRAGRDADFYRFMVEDLLAHVCLELGAFDRAAALLVTDPPPEPPMRPLVRGELRAYAAALAGDGSEITARWRQVLAAAEAAPVSETRKTRIATTASAWLPADKALAICERALEVAQRRDSPVLRQLALLRRAQARQRCGKTQAALDDIAALLPTVRTVQSIYISKPESWLTAADVFESVGDRGAACECLAHGRDWLMAAQVPPETRRDFLERHPVHRALLLKASELLDK